MEQYITLLDRYEIALPLDNRRMLIPSVLPVETKFSEMKEPTFYSRCFLFSSPTPPGLWGRLLTHIMYTVEKISIVLGELVPIKSFHSNNMPTQPSTASSKILVFPNFYEIKHLVAFNSFDFKHICFEIWQTGLYYSDPEVTFKLESIVGSKQCKQSNNGINISASRNIIGIKTISELIDVVISLIHEWYPDLQKRQHDLKQRVPCYECVKLGRARPFDFDIEQCLQAIVDNRTMVECGYLQDDSKKNHSVAIEDIAPDLLLQDIDPEYLLHLQDITYQENGTSLLGRGGYAEVYRGKFKGKKLIAIKKYLSQFNEQGSCELRSEAKMHCRLKHPCIVAFIGVFLQPFMALVVEEAPLNSASYPFLEKNTPICRLTVFRIATEVAAALRYMHSQRIVYRDVKAANVLLWTLDPNSLCHSKLCDLNIAACLSPIGIRGLHGCKGFIAPELMHKGKGKLCSLYDHRADIFSYGMFLYQMIARRHPYHNIPTYRIDLAVEKGERPKLRDTDHGYYYLVELMERCWDGNPSNRPDMKEIIENLCLSSMQMIMCMIPVHSEYSLRQALSVPRPSCENENNLWLCCDSVNGVEIRVYNIQTMIETKTIHIRENQIQCMAHYGDHAWVATKAGLEYGVIDIRNTHKMESVNKIYMQNKSITCLTINSETVYLGTSEGFCISYTNTTQRLKGDNSVTKESYISEYAIDGIVCVDGSVWISHTDKVSYLDLETLDIRGTITLKQSAHVGHLASGVDHILWGAHIGGVFLSAWNTQTPCHMYSIDTVKHVKKVINISSDHKLALISAMTPALDTVWVGMATGHIIIFHKDKLLCWFHVFEDYVRFLTCIPSSDPCETEKCMIASGGKNVKPLVPLHKSKHNTDRADSHVVIWEAYNAKAIRQIKLIEQQSPGHLDSYDTLYHIIRTGDFNDATNILLHSLPNESFSNANNVPVCDTCIVGQEEKSTSSA